MKLLLSPRGHSHAWHNGKPMCGKVGVFTESEGDELDCKFCRIQMNLDVRADWRTQGKRLVRTTERRGSPRHGSVARMLEVPHE